MPSTLRMTVQRLFNIFQFSKKQYYFFFAVSIERVLDRRNRRIYRTSKEFVTFVITMKRYFLLLILFMFVFGTHAQDPNSRLTKKLSDCSGEGCIQLIQRTYEHARNTKIGSREELQFWTFYVYDSLSLDKQADSVCRILIGNKQHRKLTGAHKLYVLLGNQQL